MRLSNKRNYIASMGKAQWFHVLSVFAAAVLMLKIDAWQNSDYYDQHNRTSSSSAPHALFQISQTKTLNASSHTTKHITMQSFYYKLIALMLLFNANLISSVKVRSLLGKGKSWKYSSDAEEERPSLQVSSDADEESRSLPNPDADEESRLLPNPDAGCIGLIQRHYWEACMFCVGLCGIILLAILEKLIKHM